MSNPSNLYAEKIFSEHPLVLWALDDKADYVSLITEEQRDIGPNWQGTGGGASPIATPSDAPFQDSVTTILYGDVPAVDGEEVIAWSPDLKNFSDLDPDLGTISVGTYFYLNSVYVSSISIGIEYTDTTSSQIVRKFETFFDPVYANWSLISATFDIPNENANFRMFIKFTTITGGASSNDYQILFNGITAGQWSEEFNATSLGVEKQLVSSSIALSETYGLEAKAYGLTDKSGYYLVNKNSLVARNTTIPLVYGASGVTTLRPNQNNLPSLIIPGQGFLNEAGKYKDYTVEFWARINSDSITPFRIFGPISSTDGLYVEKGFLTLKIGNTFKSHFVGEWYRPMLIDIRVLRNSATLLLNGEQVINMSFVTKDLELPSVLNQNGKSQDWLGFYSAANVTPIEIDCVAIYHYQVPVTVAKRRWVYGQGVLSPEGINSSYGGSSALIDYPFADYTANYSYPDFAEWQQGTFDNLITNKNSLELPTYSLPEIFTNSKTIQNLYDDNLAIQSETNKFITLKPNDSWANQGAYINFPRFDILNDQVHAVYGVFKISENTSVQTLFKIYNSRTGNFFTIKKDGAKIDYYLTFNGVEEEFYSIPSFSLNTLIAVGVKFEDLVNTFGGNVAAFFGNLNGLKMYVGGDETPSNTFFGKIYSIGFCSNLNLNNLLEHFNSNGTAKVQDAEELLAHTASYTLLPTVKYGKLSLDIGVASYWEDYLPLSYFAQYVKNDVGNEYYDLDFLQFNIGYPAPSKLLEKELVTENWTYGNLYNEYFNPIQKPYSELDNFLYSGFNDYEDLAQKSNKYYEYDTADSEIKSYITFQYIEEGANALPSFFTTTQKAKEGRVIDIAEYSQWQTTKFELVDGTIIYPIKTIDFNKLAIVFYLEFSSRNTLTKPISLRRLSFISQALDNNSFNPIGTRFGIEMFPYKKSGIYYDYKSKNPFSIYKGSTPYLYMTRDSGIEVRGDFSSSVDRGINIPINKQLADAYQVSAMQIWYRYDLDNFSITPTQFFEIKYKGNLIKFYTMAIDNAGKRARVYAINDSTGELFDGLSYYINGNIVREPVLTIKEWAVLGIGFANTLDFNNFIGGINLNGPGVFNNISYYQANSLQQIQKQLTRPWADVKDDEGTDLYWQYWKENFTWQGMLVLSSSSLYGVNPSDVYKAYIGTNKIIVDDGDGMTFLPDKIKIYKDSEWSSFTITPV
jgi:hypothetical protein